ncbi:heme-degrading domain-containing protein [Granulicella sp. dw_53]|uniref:heme-degrading domain-containing protein n=1 Tax=Granulicella sp. dw_53 TaxID=2719792 RepID=UPI001BD4ED55|nr:heme-degrading domain-containing protein [Granulicella sp. dw_53]
MPIPDDLTTLALQEKELHFPQFDHDTAWALGLILRELAVARKLSIVIDIRRFGQPFQPLFYTALPGTTPDNSRWVLRKSNTVARFHRSSYAVGLYLKHTNTTIAEKHSLPDEDYAAHGGSFPLHVAGAGVLGAVTVSGLPQREDHNLVIEALCLQLRLDHQSLRLPTLQ